MYTGVRMGLSSSSEPEINPDGNPLVRFLGRHFPISQQLDGGKFFTRREGVRFATPLLIVLLLGFIAASLLWPQQPAA